MCWLLCLSCLLANIATKSSQQADTTHSQMSTVGNLANNTVSLDSRKTLHILGLFALNGTVPEGLTFLPAALLAVKHINSNHSDILPGYKLQINAYNTQCEEATALNNFYEEVYNTSRTSIMVLGATCSTPTEITAKVSHLWGLQQISYAAVSPYLSNKKVFPAFFRVTTPEQNWTVARLMLLRGFGWNKVHTVYQNQIIFSTLDEIMKQDLASAGIEVVSTEMFTDDPKNIIDNLRKNDARIIIGNMYEDKARLLMCQIYNQVNETQHPQAWYKKLVWIIPNIFLTHWMDEADPHINCTAEQITQVLGNYFSIGSRAFVKDPNYTADNNIVPVKFRTLLNGRELFDEVKELISTKHLHFFKNDSFDQDDRLKGQHRAAEAYDAVWAIAMALNATLAFLKQTGVKRQLDHFRYNDRYFTRLLHESLHNVSFNSLSGPFKFNKNGERLPGIVISQYVRGISSVDKFVDVGSCDITDLDDTWNCSLKKTAVVWENGRVPVDGIQKQPRLISTSSFKLTFWTLASVGCVLTVVLLAFNITKRKHRVIKMSSPNLNNVILLGCLMAYSSVFIIDFTGDGAHIACLAHTLTIVHSFSLCFGALFAKTWRVYEIFTAGVRVLNTKMLKDSSLFLMVAALVLINTLILIGWVVVSPQSPVLFNISTVASSVNGDIEYINQYQRCDSKYRLHFMSTLLAIQGIVMLFGTFLAIQTRKVSFPELNDSKWIALSIYNVLVLSPVGVVVVVATKEKPEISYALEAAMIILITAITECLVFVPKIISYKKGDNGSTANSRSDLRLRKMEHSGDFSYVSSGRESLQKRYFKETTSFDTSQNTNDGTTRESGRLPVQPWDDISSSHFSTIFSRNVQHNPQLQSSRGCYDSSSNAGTFITYVTGTSGHPLSSLSSSKYLISRSVSDSNLILPVLAK